MAVEIDTKGKVNTLDSGNNPAGRLVIGVLALIFCVGYVWGFIWRLQIVIQNEALTSLPAETGQANAGIAAETPATDQAVPEIQKQLDEALVMLFAGGIGSCIYIIRAYLLHSCEWKDFELQYIPWYVFWSFIGAILGFIFYFALQGGLILLTVGEDAQPATNLNIWSLAFVGALVGLFSKYAIEKLRQVIVILFAGKDVLDQDADEQKIINAIRLAKLNKKLEGELNIASTGSQAQNEPAAQPVPKKK